MKAVLAEGMFFALMLGCAVNLTDSRYVYYVVASLSQVYKMVLSVVIVIWCGHNIFLSQLIYVAVAQQTSHMWISKTRTANWAFSPIQLSTVRLIF